MILIKVDNRKAKYGVYYNVVNEETNETIYKGRCSKFSYVSDLYYDLKDKYGSKNVRMILK
ncbi:hypothetical protein BAOM_3046 [Peribacillus asahii]|uniref:GIY-YIG domain-containing protein n=1 Tax=Peribacillus asahii TaxID=228899 RepID=A0A3T0KTS8_9BACI|nr:hypothetical protein [Peribacillus asahii]AZV43655.1 hypothetical protein BAOM_3046 [Peribacillus asahii]